MFKSSAKSLASTTSDSKTIDLVVVLAAGSGNARLLDSAGVPGEQRMQRRPLKMAMLRGPLPELWGHWVSGAHTRLTITTALGREAEERVWALGGKLAEDHNTTRTISVCW